MTSAFSRIESVQDVIAALDKGGFGHDGNTAELRAQCPAHDGAKLSMSAKMSDNGEKLLISCHSHECDFVTGIAPALRAAARGERISSKAVQAGTGGKGSGNEWWKRDHITAATYTYRDEVSGKVLFTKDRINFTDEAGGKTYVVRPRGGAVESFYGVQRLAYSRTKGETVWWVEGEKDADTLSMQQVTGVSIHHGAKPGVDTVPYIAQLRGIANVVVAVDRDLVGYRYGLHVYNALVEAGISAEVRRTSLDVPKADLTDHIEAGLALDDMEVLTAEDLRALIAVEEMAAAVAKGEPVAETTAETTETVYDEDGYTGSDPYENGDADYIDGGMEREDFSTQPTTKDTTPKVAAVMNPDDVKVGDTLESLGFTEFDLAVASRMADDDNGLAERIEWYAKGLLAWHAGERRWFSYADGVWTEGAEDTIANLANRIVRSLHLEVEVVAETAGSVRAAAKQLEVAVRLGDSDRADKAKAALEKARSDARNYHSKFAKISNTGSGHQVAAVDNAHHRLSVPEEKWKEKQWVLNVKNGVLNVKTGVLTPHHPSQYHSKITAAAYVPGAAAASPDLGKVLRLMELNGTGLTEVHQRFIGAALTGDLSAKSILLVAGEPHIGKTTFYGAAAAALGTLDSPTSYSVYTDPATFAIKKNVDADKASLAKHRLRGARFILAVEAGANTLDVHALNSFSGGEPELTRELHQGIVSWQPEAYMGIIGNDFDKWPVKNTAFVQRAITVKYWRTIPDADMDSGLLERMKMQHNLDAVLDFAVQGAQAWLADGKDRGALKTPQYVLDTKAALVQEGGDLSDWLQGVTPHKQEEGEAPMVYEAPTSEELHAHYAMYSSRHRVQHPLLQRAFNKELKRLGFEPESTKRSGKSVRVYRGLTLDSMESRMANIF